MVQREVEKLPLSYAIDHCTVTNIKGYMIQLYERSNVACTHILTAQPTSAEMEADAASRSEMPLHTAHKIFLYANKLYEVHQFPWPSFCNCLCCKNEVA